MKTMWECPYCGKYWEAPGVDNGSDNWIDPPARHRCDRRPKADLLPELPIPWRDD